MSISAFLAAFLLSASVPSVYGTEEGCLVEDNVQITNTADTRILCLFKPDKPLTFIVEFVDRDREGLRDWVSLNNSRVMHGKVRGEQMNLMHNLSLELHEGWKTLSLDAVGPRFKLTQLPKGGDETTLFHQKLDFDVSSVHVMGICSICSEGSPEWKVAEGKEVSIPLQPESNQTLRVIGPMDASPYLLDMSSSPDLQKNITTNTTLSIETRRRRSVTQVKVYQIGTEKALADMRQPLASPTVQMGCRAGTLHLRLDLFDSPSPALPTPPATKDCHSADSSGDSQALWPMGYVLFFCGIALGCLLGETVALLVRRKRARRATTSVVKVCARRDLRWGRNTYTTGKKTPDF